MLKKVSIDQLRLGMYVHELCGPWVEHPFWKSRFELSRSSDLQKLRDSSVLEFWIDLSKGVDVLASPVEAPAAAEPAAPEDEMTAPMARGATAPVPMSDELGRAAALLRQSRTQVMSMFHEARMGRALEAENCLPLVNDITESVWRNPGALVGLARLKTHDDYSYMHSVAVCALMVALARQLGQTEAQAREAGLAGLLHDIGKVMMPLDVLNKPGKLTAAEYDIMRSHPQRGYDLLKAGSSVPEIALDVCLHHHERPDGRGYPVGLSDPALSAAARMCAVCDVYDAITSNRPYKEGWDPAESVSRMSGWAQAGQFDTQVFAAFVKSLGVYPVGSLVRMRSGRLAVVVEQGHGQLLKPQVKVFFSTQSRMPVPIELLDTSNPHCSDIIAARESNAVWKFKHLDELWAGREAIAVAKGGQ